MQRVTITLDDAFMAELDHVIDVRGYQNRSEAIRDLARSGLREAAQEHPQEAGQCVAAVVYVYRHDARDLSKRLTQTFHDRHDLSLSSLHVHLDHQSCMEIAILKGETRDVLHVADHIIAERGVRHGRIVMVPVEIENADHDHGGTRRPHQHTHVRDGS